MSTALGTRILNTAALHLRRTAPRPALRCFSLIPPLRSSLPTSPPLPTPSNEPHSSGDAPSQLSKPKGKARTPPKQRTKKTLPELKEEDLEESFVRGSGPGGQATNKTSNACSLIHKPTGIRVHCHETRSRETNRKLARRILRDKLDQLLSPPGASARDLAAARERQKKEAKKRKAKRKKAASAGEPVEEGESGEGVSERDGMEEGWVDEVDGRRVA
ncbi:hypothetical protein JCM10207_007859 [Rhodosporidiobolus poonsookiae]